MSASSLLLLADHIKLSLLEQQRARSLGLKRDSQEGYIARSLDQFRDGLEALEKEQQRLQAAGDESKATSLADTVASLRKQYTELSSQFHGFTSAATSSTLTSPNDPALAADFAHAQSSASANHQSEQSSSQPIPQSQQQQPLPKKAVRFSSLTADLESQTPLPPYRDDPTLLDDDDSAGYARNIAVNNLTNAQIHAYHQRILAEQDAQLDALGASIARQRELSMQIGDELDSQVALLDESERAMDRHEHALGRARRHVGRIARGASRSSEGRQLGVIVMLIVVLILLIIILK